MTSDGRESLVADGTVTVDEAARFTGLGRTSLYDAMAEGRLAFVKVGARRLIPRRALVQLLAEGVQGGRAGGGTEDAA